MKKDVLVQKAIAVKKSMIQGYGVFAEQDFVQGEIIEECHAILTYGGDDILKNYYYSGGRYYVVSTGFGLIYNHAIDPNATYIFDKEQELLIFKACRVIKKGEEILISYGDGWFGCRNMEIKHISWWRRLRLFLMGMPLRLLVVCGGIYLLIFLLDHTLSTSHL